MPLCYFCFICAFFFLIPHTGFTINGQLVGSKKIKNNKINTYFGTISIYSKTDAVQVIIGTDRIELMEGMNNHSFSWGATLELMLNRYQRANLNLLTVGLKTSPLVKRPTSSVV